MNRQSSIAIVGGSITGPALALLLRQCGFSNVHVFEATPESVQQAGGVIGLDHVSLDILERLGVCQSEIVPFTSERVVAVKLLDRNEMGRVRTIYPGRNVTWTLINHALTQRLPAGTFHGGKRVAALGCGPDGRAALTFTDGSQMCADLVAFADGRRSTGRKLLDPSRPLRYAGYVAHRGLLPWCPPDVQDFRRYEGAAGVFAIFPVPTVFEPQPMIGLDWTLYADCTADEFHDMFGANPTARTFVLPHQITAAARRCVNDRANTLLPNDLATLVHSTRERTAAPMIDIEPPTQAFWPVGDAHVLLLGDALAPVRPHTARGANDGIQSADRLVTALRQHINHDADLNGALFGWQERALLDATHALQRGPELGKALGLGLKAATT